MTFKKTPLYGGAISVELPAAFVDTSQIRQVPDHQEVYLDDKGYSAVIVEILERVGGVSDEEALQHHFHDLIAGTGDQANVLGQAKVDLGKMPEIPAYTLNVILTPPPSDNPGRKTPDFVSVALILVRLKEKATDLLITVNVPHYPEEYKKSENGSATELMQEGETYKLRFLETLEILDWGLFDG